MTLQILPKRWYSPTCRRVSASGRHRTSWWREKAVLTIEDIRIDTEIFWLAYHEDSPHSSPPPSAQDTSGGVWGQTQKLIAAAPVCDHQIQCECDEDAMLDLANDIRSLSEFKRNTVDLLDRLRKTGHPLVLTINGKAELVVQDAAAYQTLLDRVEAIEGIQQGLADVKAGRTKPARQIFARLRRKHGIPR